MRTNRRHFIAGLGAAAPLSSLVAADSVAATADSPDYFSDLGVRPFINAIGPYSSLGGAEMWPEVIDAMDYAIKNKARMTELHDAVGKRISELTGADAAMVTSGATCAIMLGTAACMTLGDEEKMERLPDTTGMANEVIILKSQRYLYDRSIRAPGAKLVEVETAADVRDAINPKTAMLFYLLNRPDDHTITIPDYVAIARENGIPILCDAATTVPPVSNLKATVAAGFDLVCYSGGKGLRGPYSAGLLLGRPDLIEYARAHSSPNHRAFGRAMKVAPEEYLGMMVAVEKSMTFDEAGEFQRQLSIVEGMDAYLSTLPGITTSIGTPGAEAREPYVEIRWDAARYKITPAELKQALRDSDPSIEIRALFLSAGQIHLTATMLKPGEDDIVVATLRKLLQDSV
jgi:uncharacterized pyridoxal phosphate-dependent enzyme